MKERRVEYLKEEFGIETEEDFEKVASEFHGVDISILGGDCSASETNQMEKCC